MSGVQSIYLQSPPFAFDPEKYIIFVSLTSSLKIIGFALSKILSIAGLKPHRHGQKLKYIKNITQKIYETARM